MSNHPLQQKISQIFSIIRQTPPTPTPTQTSTSTPTSTSTSTSTSQQPQPSPQTDVLTLLDAAANDIATQPSATANQPVQALQDLLSDPTKISNFTQSLANNPPPPNSQNLQSNVNTIIQYLAKQPQTPENILLANTLKQLSEALGDKSYKNVVITDKITDENGKTTENKYLAGIDEKGEVFIRPE